MLKWWVLDQTLRKTAKLWPQITKNLNMIDINYKGSSATFNDILLSITLQTWCSQNCVGRLICNDEQIQLRNGLKNLFYIRFVLKRAFLTSIPWKKNWIIQKLKYNVTKQCIGEKGLSEIKIFTRKMLIFCRKSLNLIKSSVQKSC